MAEQKIFAGPRLRRVRSRLGLTQSQMAADIGISASYLNLIERNQRPLTVQVILKLSAAFDINVSELHAADAGTRLDDLKAVFTDPLLASELPSTDELAEIVDAAPNVGIAIPKLYRAYQETLARLSDLSRDIAAMSTGGADGQIFLPAGALPAGGSPHDRVIRWFEAEGPWFADLEDAAEKLAATLTPRDDPFAAIKTALARDHHIDVRILPVKTMPDALSRYDRHAMRLYLSERLPLVDRPFFTAILLVALTERDLLDQLAGGAGLEMAEARRLCRAAFTRRLAAATLLPMSRLQRLPAGELPDIAALGRRNTLSPARLMARLAAAGASESEHSLPPTFLMTVDAAGTVLGRTCGARFPFARFGANCAMLPLFDAGPVDGVTTGSVIFPDGRIFDTAINRECHTVSLTGERAVQTTTMIAFARQSKTNAEAEADSTIHRLVGATCRLCERKLCPARVSPSATEPAAIRDDIIGPACYESI